MSRLDGASLANYALDGACDSPGEIGGDGSGATYRELAAAGHVSRARLSQILQLTHLAPDIQEQLLFLPPTREGCDRMLEKRLRPFARVVK